jgi:hypothetical protein
MNYRIRVARRSGQSHSNRTPPEDRDERVFEISDITDITRENKDLRTNFFMSLGPTLRVGLRGSGPESEQLRQYDSYDYSSEAKE